MYAFPPGVAPLCSEDDLPVPANGNKSCKAIMSHDLKCELTCSANHHFGTSLDISPQYCRNGEWDFKRDSQSVPDCVGELNIVHARYIQAYLSSNQLHCEVALVCELSFRFSITTSLPLILIFSEFLSHSMSAVEAHCNQKAIHHISIFLTVAVQKPKLTLQAIMVILRNCTVYQQYQASGGRGIPQDIRVQCLNRRSLQGKRSVGDDTELELTFTFSEEVPLNCDADCLNDIALNLYFKAWDLELRIALETIHVTVMNVNSLSEENVTLSGTLAINHATQKACDPGRILSEDETFCCKLACSA